jgi:hypothetical protein
MQPDPPPERPLDEPEPFEAKGVRLVTVGLTGDQTAEVIARRVEVTPDENMPDVVHWFRFNLKVSSRYVKKFLRKAGIRDPARAEEGAYQYMKGLGPLKMVGSIVGLDSEDLGDGSMSHTFVMADVVLNDQTFVMADVVLNDQTVIHTPNKKLVKP